MGPAEIPPPSLRRYAARDGEELAYRIYELTSDRILIFVHGSSYHGAGYHALAAALSLVMIGAHDEAIDPGALRGLFTASAPNAQMTVVPGLNDFGIFNTPEVWETIAAWLKALPPAATAK